ncbi:uncharacterized protein PHACADRAFT_192191 [Phanerochaete carnosa HHB-10118-sp]|uniref:Retrotransposon Copia-like N-terminal domain-containing protein n=1 Tax=Phanerochaete carnosa (strain HHB-10118-sp) TaxID=650164 RepID=K5WKB4_PHACS|nr:uncharacterized protein PHACADRAFT_192191 [Phanerochaete carnosa HHB-10118-sp]EKM59815.1 hypothetical protein PHACADRAFT_192191 [Phanerochaete carnosa HHB-10118-sp]
MSSASAFASAFSLLSMKVDVIGKLKGPTNYYRWSLMMKQYFIAACTCDGTETKPVISGTVTAADLEAWENTNNYARFYIITTLSDELLHFAEKMDITTAALWKKLKDNYTTTTTMSAFVKFRAYFSHTITNSNNFAAQLDEYARLWQKVDASGAWRTPELLQIFGLLMALSDLFNNIVEPILADTKFADLKLDDIHNHLLNEVKCCTTSVATFHALNMKASSSAKPKSGRAGEKGKCNFCGYKGHYEQEFSSSHPQSLAIEP